MIILAIIFFILGFYFNNNGYIILGFGFLYPVVFTIDPELKNKFD